MQPRRASFTPHAIAFAVAAAFQPQLLAQTLPSGGQVAAGQAVISQPAPGFMQIDQASHKAILNWESFSIGTGGQVNFLQQQGASSVALNRVLGNNPSQIFGNLTANGRVFLVNPSGILFGPTASVSVGGLVASTLSITDRDFLDGNYVFSNAGGAGSVVNQGSINSFSGYTALLAPQVTNEGFIFANMGNVALAAGDRVSLDMVGDNLIRVSVDQAALDAAIVNRGNLEAFGGNVLLSAHSANALLDTVLNTEGLVRASGITMQDGEIVLDGGSRGAMAIGGQVEANGRLSISGADVTVTGHASSGGGQHVNARSLSVIGSGGMVASLVNRGGEQVIAITGDGASPGLDVVLDGGLAAQIQQLDSGSAQTITVTDADHIVVDGRSPGPGPFTGAAGIFAAGTQSISITGSGRNAITVGGEGSTGAAQVNAATQSITAGAGNQSGSISVIGASATGAFVGIGAGRGGMETQTISTTGLIRIAGAPAPAQNMPTGIFHNGRGEQTIRAAGMDVFAAASGSGNGAFVNSNGGGDQWIEIAGGELRVIAGQGGANNTAGIGNTSNGNQTILGNPDILVSGGATSNAAIQPGFGKLQTIEARNITLTNGVDSPGNSAGVLLGSHQRITATGDVTLTARSATGTASGVRIGGPTAGGPTDLVLNVAGNLVLTGGTSGTNGAGLGGAGTGTAFDNNIVVVAGGDVILDGAAGGGGVRIGSSGLTAVPGGDISVTGRSIQFTGSAPAAIRTLGDVELHADQPGGTITEGANGLIVANALTTSSHGSTLLGGPNQVSTLDATSLLGDISLQNAGALQLARLDGGNVTLRNAGSMTVGGQSSARGGMDVEVSGGNLEVFAPLFAGGDQSVRVLGGDHILVQGGNGFAGILAGGSQTVSITGAGRNEIILGSAGALGTSVLNAALRQDITAGADGQQGSITLTGPDSFNGFVGITTNSGFGEQAQTVSTSGALTVQGGEAPVKSSVTPTGIFHNRQGTQTVNAGSMEIRGGGSGSGNSAFINSNRGGNQTVHVDGAILVAGGPGGGAGMGIPAAFPHAQQTISAGSITLTNPMSGANSAGSITAPHQLITTSGDVLMSAGASAGGPLGTRIGGAGGGPTDLQLYVGGNLVMTDGFAPNNGSAIGSSSSGPAFDNHIVIQAAGDVILNPTTGGGVRIGSHPANGTTDGHISITAQNIRFMGETPAAIRTLGDVVLQAGEITQAPNGFILANELATSSDRGTSLTGPNQVRSFRGTSWGDITLNNSGPLHVTDLSAFHVGLINAGPVTVSGLWNSISNTSIGTAGPGSDLVVNGAVLAGGDMNIDVSGNLALIGSGWMPARLVATGNQSINLSGGSLDVHAADGASVELSSYTGNQTIAVRDGDHLEVKATGGATVFMTAGLGTQALSITGAGRNAMAFGAEGSTGSVFLSANAQRFTAGTGSEIGSIRVIGPDADGATTQISTFASGAGSSEQTINTSGVLTVAGGSRTTGLPFLTGFVHNGAGPQSIGAARVEIIGGAGGSGNPASIISVAGGEQRFDVTGELTLAGGPGGSANLFSTGAQSIAAADILVQGASLGANNGAFIATNPGVSQHIDVSGRIDVNAGDGGTNNGAGINSRGSQTIVGRPDIAVRGGAGGNATIQSLGGMQHIEAHDIFLTNAESSPVNSAGAIQGPLQRIDASGDVTLLARSGTGTASGVRIGAQGAGATDLVLAVGGELLLRGGTSGTNGAALGGSGSGATSDNNIVVVAQGDVILDGAAGGGGARIGSSALTPVQAGDISVTGRSIRFTGTAPAAIRTLGNVELNAGTIEQGASGLILANSLSTTSTGATLLGGANDVSSFSGFAGGDLLLRNLSSFLTLGPVDAAGALSIDQAGSLLIQAGETPLVVRGGQVSVVTGGDLRLVGGSGYRARAELASGGDIDATIGGAVRLDTGTGDEAWARIRSESADGVMRLAFPNLTSGGFYVDGVEGDVKHGLTGFFILNKPVKIGETLLLEYQQ